MIFTPFIVLYFHYFEMLWLLEHFGPRLTFYLTIFHLMYIANIAQSEFELNGYFEIKSYKYIDTYWETPDSFE